MNLNQSIGALLAKYRRNEGMTQESLAEKANMHPDYIGKIERGERMPSVESLLRILQCLEVSYSDFFLNLEK